VLVSEDGSVSCQPAPLDIMPSAPVRLRLSPEPVHSDNPFLYHKTTHRQVYESAMKNCPGCDDVVLYKLITPPVRCGLLKGTFRSWLTDQGELEEDIISIEMLRQSSHICLINSVRKWREGFLDR